MLRLMATVFILIVILSSDGVSASIPTNHHTRKAASTAFRRTTNHGFGHRTDSSTVGRSRRRLRKNMNDCSVNLWSIHNTNNVRVRPPYRHRQRSLAAAAMGATTWPFDGWKIWRRMPEARPYKPSLEEEVWTARKKTSKGNPVILLLADATAVGAAFAYMYVQGGVLGYIVTGFTNAHVFFRKRPPSFPPPIIDGRLLLPPPRVTDELSFWQKIKFVNGKGVVRAKSWSLNYGSYFGFHAFISLIRKEEDKWDAIVASACTGAFVNRNAGRMAMFKGATKYGGVLYLYDLFMGIPDWDDEDVL